MKKKYKFLTILVGIFLTIYFSINYFIGKENYILKSFKGLFSSEQKYLVKKIFFPHKVVSYLEREKSALEVYYTNQELDFKKSGKDILVGKMKDVELSNGYNLSKYNLIGGFYTGIKNKFPGSGYLDFHSDSLIILSSRGVLAYTKNIDDLNFKQIKNNINDFIGLEEFVKNSALSLKDLTIHKNKIFISYTEEIKPNCWNTSVVSGIMDYEYIKFKKFFSSKDCVHPSKNIEKSVNARQSGGRIINFDENNILLSVGDYRSRYLAQDKDSINGKIIKINLNNSVHEIFSMGHRNPQGLLLDMGNKFILETEHGPMGGDEINLIEINNTGIPNYGWAIVSAGKHYTGKGKDKDKFKKLNKLRYEKYPLYKSHAEHGFIEPLHSFVPSIGISEISQIGKNKYVTSALIDKSLYFFELNEKKKITNLSRVEIFERIRDIKFKENKLYLFLEDTASIGIININ